MDREYEGQREKVANSFDFVCLRTRFEWEMRPIFSYKLRYIGGVWLVEMVISTKQKPTIYHNLYENTGLPLFALALVLALVGLYSSWWEGHPVLCMVNLGLTIFITKSLHAYNKFYTYKIQNGRIATFFSFCSKPRKISSILKFDSIYCMYQASQRS